MASFLVVDGNALNGRNDVQFTLGFVYDGHTDYKDLAKSKNDTLISLSTLYVYDDPDITTLLGANEEGVLVSIFTAWVDKTILRILGEHVCLFYCEEMLKDYLV